MTSQDPHHIPTLAEAERALCERALHATGSIVDAAQALGVTRHALKRRIVKHKIVWPRQGPAQD